MVASVPATAFVSAVFVDTLVGGGSAATVAAAVSLGVVTPEPASVAVLLPELI